MKSFLPSSFTAVRPRIRKVLPAALVLCLAGCSIGPNFFRPKAPVPPAYKEMAGWKQAEPRDHELRGNWWEMYNDPVLNGLEAQVNVSNQTLAQAEARYRQSRALVAQARSAYFPVVDVSASSNRSQSGSGGSTTGGSRPAVNSHRLSADATWEPDLWGRIRRTVEANVASAQASAADVESVRLSIQSDLAQSYFALRAVDAQKRILDENVRAFEASLKLTQNRYDAGVVARVDVVQAQSQMQATQAQAIDTGVQRAQLEHAIAVLVGKSPAELSLALAPLDEIVPPAIPVGLPSALLERRPDIAGAERRVAAANAQIGVAQAAYFPALTLSASGGFASATIGNLISTPARFWSLGLGLAQTLFDAGARRARTQQAVALYDETVGAYRQTVLTGFQEVEDNLAALRILEEESAVQAEALAGARQSVDLALNQYKSGIVSYLNVLTAQTTALTNERTAVDLRSRRLAASVLLVRALGGGWNASALPSARETAR
ncbi:MAG: efflux system, outer rane lipoprotein NodT family protein [Betaproteobacteria bacterium]|nr:efflux system, outer rane lipoprotein NodT family protein [Betaproteobacteria bacterium]